MLYHDYTLTSTYHLGTSCAVILLECAVEVGSCSRKLTASVYSSLAVAFWRNSERDKAVRCMEKELDITQGLGEWDLAFILWIIITFYRVLLRLFDKY